MNKFNNVVLYDGECGFCSFWVQWLLKWDKNNSLKFAALQSQYAQSFLKENNLNNVDFDTIYYIKDNKGFYQQSTAIIEIVSSLRPIFKLFVILKLIPRSIRDFIYNMISKNRKKLMNVNCLLPTKEQRKQFID